MAIYSSRVPLRATVTAMICALLLSVFADTVSLQVCESSLTETTIPPWLDPYGGTPNITLTLQFAGQAAMSNQVDNGRVLTVNQTATQPTVFLSGPSLDAGASYTLLCLDPDGYNPSTPILRNVIHWIISNVPGSVSPSQDIAQVGDIVLRYLEPRPPTVFPPPYGIHRYYTVLFKQARTHENLQNITTPLPSNFNTRDYIHAYQLGYPVAGTVFGVNFDVS